MNPDKAMSVDEAGRAIAAGRMDDAEVEDWYLSRPVSHREWDRVLDEIKNARWTPAREPIEVLVGPAGVGKTALLLTARNLVLHNSREAMLKDAKRLEAIYVDPDAPMREEFDWSAFLGLILRELHEPDLTVRLVPQPPGSPQDWSRRQRVEQPLLSELARRALRRHLRVLFVDELRLIAWNPREAAVKKHLDRLKSLANHLRAQIVAAAAYDGLELWDLNGQLIRRINRRHFRRYLDSKEDLKAFGEALDALVARMPLPFPPGFDLEVAYEGSMGCVGLLAQWLAKALGRAVADGSPRVREGHLRETVRPEPDLEAMLEEARQGEAKVTALATGWDDTERRLRYRIALGLDRATGLSPESAQSEEGRGVSATVQSENATATSQSEPTKESPETKSGSGGRSRGGRKPFAMRPHRNPVGPSARDAEGV